MVRGVALYEGAVYSRGDEEVKGWEMGSKTIQRIGEMNPTSGSALGMEVRDGHLAGFGQRRGALYGIGSNETSATEEREKQETKKRGSDEEPEQTNEPPSLSHILVRRAVVKAPEQPISVNLMPDEHKADATIPQAIIVATAGNRSITYVPSEGEEHNQHQWHCHSQKLLLITAIEGQWKQCARQ